jgi:hypothetical protein
VRICKVKGGEPRFAEGELEMAFPGCVSRAAKCPQAGFRVEAALSRATRRDQGARSGVARARDEVGDAAPGVRQLRGRRAPRAPSCPVGERAVAAGVATGAAGVAVPSAGSAARGELTMRRDQGALAQEGGGVANRPNGPSANEGHQCRVQNHFCVCGRQGGGFSGLEVRRWALEGGPAVF